MIPEYTRYVGVFAGYTWYVEDDGVELGLTGVNRGARGTYLEGWGR